MKGAYEMLTSESVGDNLFYNFIIKLSSLNRQHG